MSDQRILGVDIGGTAVKLVVHDRGVDAIPAGEILRAEIPTDPGDAHETFRRLAAYLAEHCGDFVPQAVGIACAGIVDTDLGRLHRAPNLPDWQGVDLAKVADETWPGCRVVWANDVNAALAGEAAVGAGAGHRDIVMLALGTGVGGAVMLDGRLHTGRRFGAGEIGHMILDPDGPLCECGNRGCLEAYAGAKAILRAAGRAADQTPADLAAAAEQGDEAAIGVFRAAGERLGHAVGNLLNILDPDIVIIGGGVARAGELILAPCRETARNTVLCEKAKTTPIVPALLNAYAAATGAAILTASAGGDA